MLNAYLTQVRRLLRDANAQFWQNPELTDYINDARRRVAIDSGCLRMYLKQIPAALGQEQFLFSSLAIQNITGYAVVGNNVVVTFSALHPFQIGYVMEISGVTTPTALNAAWAVTAISIPTAGPFTATFTPPGGVVPFTGVYAGAGVANVQFLDVLDVYFYLNGMFRYALKWMAWSMLSRKLRLYTNYQDYPVAFAQYGQTLFCNPPAPSATTFDLDMIPLPSVLVDDTTPEAIPLAFQMPIRYYAAHLAKFNEQKMDEAAAFERKYNMEIWISARSQSQRRLANGYT